MTLEEAMAQIEDLRQRLHELTLMVDRNHDYACSQVDRLEGQIERVDGRLRDEERARENAIYDVERDISSLQGDVRDAQRKADDAYYRANYR